jgi:hypothetical protein
MVTVRKEAIRVKRRENPKGNSFMVGRGSGVHPAGGLKHATGGIEHVRRSRFGPPEKSIYLELHTYCSADLVGNY